MLDLATTAPRPCYAETQKGMIELVVEQYRHAGAGVVVATACEKLQDRGRQHGESA